MHPLNRYSLVAGGGLLGLLGALLLMLGRTRLGLALMLVASAGPFAMWRFLRTGPSTVQGAEPFRQALAGGGPVLVEVVSDT